MLLQQAPFRDRENFGDHLNWLGLKGTGVEVGTHRGAFALDLLRQWDCRRLFCVDNYASGYSDRDPVSKSDREADYEFAKKKLVDNPFVSGKVRLLRMSSAEALGMFSDDALDLVYVDANHERESFRFDLEAWWQKVRRGGIFAGHDVICPGEPIETNWGAEIQPVLFEFAARHSLTVFLVVETKSLPWSWYVSKPL